MQIRHNADLKVKNKLECQTLLLIQLFYGHNKLCHYAGVKAIKPVKTVKEMVCQFYRSLGPVSQRPTISLVGC